MVAPEKARGDAEAYIEAAIPPDPDYVERQEVARDDLLKEVENMEPIPMSNVKIGGMPALQSSMLNEKMLQNLRRS